MRYRCGSSETLREQLGEPSDRSMLKGLDGTLVAVHDLGRLGHGQALQEAELDAFLLVGVEFPDTPEQLVVGGAVQYLLLGAMRARRELDDLARGLLQPVPTGLHVVEDQVPRDGDEPRTDVAALVADRRDAAQCADERLLG